MRKSCPMPLVGSCMSTNESEEISVVSSGPVRVFSMGVLGVAILVFCAGFFVYFELLVEYVTEKWCTRKILILLNMVGLI